MFFNNLKYKLYPKFHNLADSTAVWKPKLGLALFLRDGQLFEIQLCWQTKFFPNHIELRVLICALDAFSKMLACQKKTDSLLCIYKGETRHLLSFCVPCSSLSL